MTYMAASRPLLLQLPLDHRELKMSVRLGFMAEQQIWLVKQQRTSPTAIGRTLESFVLQAVKGAPANPRVA